MKIPKISPLYSTILLIAVSALCIVFFALILREQKITNKNFFAKGDFPVFYVTAKAAFNGERIYHNPDFAKEIAAARGAKGAVRYLYPPLVLALFFPLLFFTHNQAVWIWFGANMFFIAGLIFFTLYLIRQHKSLWRYSVYLALLVPFGPILQAVSTGQVNILMACMLLLYLICLDKKNHWVAALFLASIIFIKLFPLVLLGYHVLKKEWRFVIKTGIVLMVLSVLSVLVFGITNNIDYIKRATRLTTQGIHSDKLARQSNATLNGVLHRQFIQTTSPQELPKKEQLVKGIRYSVVFLLGCGLLLLTYLNRTAVSNTDRITEVGLWMSFVFFGAADMHLQYFTFLLPFLYIHLTYTPYFKKNTPALILLAASFILIALSEGSAFSLPNKQFPISIGFLGNGIFMATVSWYYYRSRLLHKHSS